ncbi:22896_t:CDS:2 [Cetraspora pellucida]|uniref:22896_t:CDS:1 n=1 Tax=Cetraspora pellucida TaxID=1433469 RepID=A0A9N9NLE1_9GLOM|nr:22896_t:CDS:2 [Cetraspora pellucida]
MNFNIYYCTKESGKPKQEVISPGQNCISVFPGSLSHKSAADISYGNISEVNQKSGDVPMFGTVVELEKQSFTSDSRVNNNLARNNGTADKNSVIPGADPG